MYILCDSVMGPILIPSFHRPMVMLVASDIVPVTSCGPLVHSSACTLCVSLMACLSPLDMGHPLQFSHMYVHLYNCLLLLTYYGHGLFSLLTCSDIVLHVSSELYIVPTSIYSCHSSTVHRCHLHGIMESQCRVHGHSSPVCVCTC